MGGNKLSLLARRTYRFPHHARKRVMRHLQALRVHGKMSKTFAVAEKRRDALRSIVPAFSGNSGAPDWDDVPVIKFPCFGPYYRKKVLEMILLAGDCRLGCLRIDKADLQTLTDVYPVPTESRKELRRIFLKANSKKRIATALRDLQRASSRSTLDVTVLVPRLCWWKQHRDGKIKW